MDIPQITSVIPLPPAQLLLGFSDGSQRRFDCAPYFDRGVFARLKDPVLFAQARLACGTVCWPGGLDIAPETLYLKSKQAAPSEALQG